MRNPKTLVSFAYRQPSRSETTALAILVLLMLPFQNCGTNFEAIKSSASQSSTFGIASVSEAGISKGNLSVSLNPRRGGLVGSIVVAGVGETLVDDMDGRGLGSSGFAFDELGGANGGVWNEGGCDGGSKGGNGLSDVTMTRGADFIAGRANSLVNWNNANADCTIGGVNAGRNVQIEHRVNFPIDYDGAVGITETVNNPQDVSLTPSQFNDGYRFPIFPQAHFDASRFGGNQGPKYWRARSATGTWFDVPVDRSIGWLVRKPFSGHPQGDFYQPAGHALAFYSDASHGWGVALYSPEDDAGFWAKDMMSFGIVFVGSVWNVTSAIPGHGTKARRSYVIYGSETTIAAAIATIDALNGKVDAAAQQAAAQEAAAQQAAAQQAAAQQAAAQQAAAQQAAAQQAAAQQAAAQQAAAQQAAAQQAAAQQAAAQQAAAQQAAAQQAAAQQAAAQQAAAQQAAAQQAAADAANRAKTLVPIYRRYNAGLDDHLFTRDAGEGDGLGYATEGNAFRLATENVAGTVVLVRCRTADYDRFLSVDGNCEGSIGDGVLGYMQTSNVDGTRALYRMYSGERNRHLATTNPAEGLAAGYRIEGVYGYVW